MELLRASAFAPATVANVGCGFDVLGFALSQPGDVVHAERVASPGIHIASIAGDEGRLPTQPQRNTASVAVASLLHSLGHSSGGVALHIHKQMPLGSGLGSSAASAVAALLATHALLGLQLPRLALLPHALQAEAMACGSAHADNVAPCLLGGFVLIRSYCPLDVVPLPVPPQLHAVVVHPNVEVATRDARDIMRRNLSLEVAVRQWGNVGGLVAGLHTADYALIGRSLEDGVAEPVRALLIPAFAQVKEAALAAGALGCSISGSGPSIFALAQGTQQLPAIAAAMQQAFAQVGIASQAHVGAVGGGAQLL